MRSICCSRIPSWSAPPTLLAGRAEVAAQSSTESVLIATREARWSESTRGCAAAAGGRRLLRHAAPACADRSPARSRRQSNPRPTPRRGDQRSVLEPPVWPFSTRAGYRADHQRRIDGDRWRCGSGVFWCDGRHRDAGRLGASSDAGGAPVRRELRSLGWRSPEAVAVPTRVRVAPGHDPGARGRRTSGGRSHDARPAP